MDENEAAFQYFAGKSLGFLLLQGKESKKRNVIRISDRDFLLVRNETQPARTWKASGNYLFNFFTRYGVLFWISMLDRSKKSCLLYPMLIEYGPNLMKEIITNPSTFPIRCSFVSFLSDV